MRVLQSMAIFSFVAGATMLLFGVLNAGGSEKPKEGPVHEFDLVSALTETPEAAVATVTEVPPEPTPAPFDGKVTRLKIPRFKVDSLVEEIGLKANNELDVPHNPHNSGWYTPYSKPGFDGNAVFSAHVDYWPDIRGPFYNLKSAEPDDEIVIQMENGEEYHYRVIRKKRYDVATIPMGDLIWPKDRPAGKQWVTLITCGGDFVSATPGGPGEYLHRDVVVAERIQ